MKCVCFLLCSFFVCILFLIVILLFVSLVMIYLVVLNFVILLSFQQFNKVLVYEVCMLMIDKLQLEDGIQLVVFLVFCCEIYCELGILFYFNEVVEDVGLCWVQYYEFLSQQMVYQFGGFIEVWVEVNKSFFVVWLKIWLLFNIWVWVLLIEIYQGDFLLLFCYILVIMLLVIGGVWLFICIQNCLLVDLEYVVLQVGCGIILLLLCEYGVFEVCLVM